MNPFDDVITFVTDESLINKLSDASIMWNVLTNDGKNIDDDKLMTVLIANDLDYLLTEYFVHKDGDNFDWEGFKKEMETWAFLN